MTADPTRIARVRQQISALWEQGLDSVDIAARLGSTVTRVNQILDQLEESGQLPNFQLPEKVDSVPAPRQEAAPAKAVPAGHGTRGGYHAHRRRNEVACGPCLEANRQEQRDRAAAKRAVGEPKPKVLVHWLIPRGATMDGAHLEYAVEVAGRVVPCDFDTAEVAAAHDERVLSRWATDWRDAR